MCPFEHLEQKLRRFVIDNFLFDQASALGNADSFMENGVIDSTGMLELLTYIEREFGITIDPGELIPENLDSLDALTRFVARKLKQPAPAAAPQPVEA